jgi:hypothetical protein
MRKMSTRRYHNNQGIHFLGPVQRTAVGAMAILSILAAGWAGYEIGQRDLDAPQVKLVDSLHLLFDAERRALDREKRATGEHLDALARKMGEMQAELLRLDALGERLVEIGGLDAGEFDFQEIPAMGGPGSTDDVSVGLPEMMADLEQLAQHIEDRNLKLDLLEDLLLRRQVKEESKPAGRPVARGWVSSRYGWRKDPITGRKNMHRGLDFAGKRGSDIIAVADGLVTWAGGRSGYGKTVEIRHGNGYLTRYAHNSNLLVKKGVLVRQGQVIAAMGRSGRTTGVHLHFEVIRDGKTVNPLKFVKDIKPRKKTG